MDYKQAGVDIAAGDALVDWLKSNQPAKWPHQERMVSGIGGFSALFRADFAEMKEPCLVSSTDGIGTKIKLAVEFKEYKGVAQDLVAMSVNDLICCGAEPLFFLDYYACGKLQLDAAKSFLAGLQEACIEANCALIGGETAEMPGVYHGDDFDAAGFCVGVVDREEALGSHKVQDGDIILGVRSSGFHSNGFSLLRKLFADDLQQWKDELLKPTHLYVKLAKKFKAVGGVNAMANITGGGLDNILRVLPKGSQFEVQPWDVPQPFIEAKSRAKMTWEQILKTLNCGVGLAVIVNPNQVDALKDCIKDLDFEGFELGVVQVDPSRKESQWNLSGAWDE